MKVSSAREVLDSCRSRFVLVGRAGENIELEPLFPEDFPMPRELVENVRRHKLEILSYLDYEGQADALLLESTRRIAAVWVPGCELDTPEWERHERTLHQAYWSGSLPRLKTALQARERYALCVFDAYLKEWQP